MYAICFVFQSYEEDDYLEKALLYIEQPNSVKETMIDAVLDEKIIINDGLREKLEKFNELAKININNMKIKFIVTSEIIDKTEVLQTNGKLLLYLHHENKYQEIDIPCKPSKPVAECIECDIQLKWTIPDPLIKSTDEAIFPSSFTIFYCDTNQLSKPNSTICINPQFNAYDTRSRDIALGIYNFRVRVHNLQPQTSYTFWISGKYKYFQSFHSEKSDPLTTKNFDQPISGPGKPLVTRINPNSMKLRWKEPKVGKTLVKSYVMYWKNTTHEYASWHMEETSSTEPIMTVCGLNNNLSYVFKVVAKCDGRVSKESEKSDPIKIMDHLPGKPGKPDVIKLSHDSIALTWDRPQHNSDLITYYLIKGAPYGNAANTQKSLCYMTTENTLTIRDLASCSYMFHIVARGDYSMSEHVQIDLSNIQELNPSLKGQKPRAIKVKSSEVKLSWEHFEILKGAEVQTFDAAVLVCNLNEPQQWREVVTNINATAYTVEKLTKNTQYKFKVSICISKTCMQSEESNIITTNKELSEPSNLIASHVTDHTVALKWDAPVDNKHLVEKYKVRYIESDAKKEKKKTIKTEKTDILIQDLLPMTTYVFKVIAKGINHGGKKIIEKSERIHVTTTEQVRPSRPTKPVIVNVTHNSVVLEWSMPKYNTLPVTHYSIFYDSKDDFGKFETIDNDPKATVDYLQPSVCYIFRVIAVCNSGSSEKSEDSEPITTEAKCCSKPGDPFAKDVTHNSVKLMWDAPKNDSEVVTHYTILCYEANETTRVIGESKINEIVISNLTPNTIYICSVLATCKSGEQIQSSCRSFRMLDTVSSPPGTPKLVETTHNSITVKWSRPVSGAQFITKYKIKCTSASATDINHVISDDEIVTFTIPNLASNREFRIDVVAECGKKTSIPSFVAMMKTKDACSKPGRPYEKSRTYDTVVLNWSKPKHNENLIKEYTVMHKLEKDENFQKLQFMISRHTGSQTIASCSIVNLEPVSRYKFKVIAHCDDNVSVESDESEWITTDHEPICSPPGKPTATDISEYGAIINWTLPEKYPELVQKFKISYIKETDYVAGWWNELLPYYNNTINQVCISGLLEPDSNYFFTVTAICRSCDIVSDISGVIRTKPDASSEPGKPIVDNVTHNKMMLSWSSPEMHCHLVQHYIVTIYDYKSGNAIEKRDTPSSKASIVIFNLKPSTTYLVEVAAKCKFCESQKSKSDPIETKEEKCSSPGKPVLSTASHNKIIITWAKPAECDHLVQYYNIHYCRYDDNEWKPTKTFEVTETKEVKPLETDTGYQFKVEAVCIDGSVTDMSEISDIIRTKKLKLVEELDLKSKLNTTYTEDGKLVFLHLNQKVEEKSKEDIKICKVEVNYGDKLSEPSAEKVLLLVGATGSGKSTMINGIANYIYGVEWEDDTRIVLISENHKKVAQDITSYTFHWQEGFPFPYTLTVIDTPGFGGMQGIKHDDEITKKIEELFKLQTAYGIDQLDGIGFVIHSSSYCLTPVQEYIYDRVLGIFGKDVASNIFVMATFDDGTGNTSQLMECLRKGGVDVDSVFQFNNGTLYQSSRGGAGTHWKLGAPSFREFFEVLGKAETKSLQYTREVLKRRAELRADIAICNAEIHMRFQYMQELGQLQKGFEQHIANASTAQPGVVKSRYDIHCVECKIICDSNCTFFKQKKTL